MSPAKRSIDDVYMVILDRLGTGAFPLGSRLPSCRRLAEDLGSNPSTVSRALQRLAADGLIRTEERRGSYVTATQARASDATTQFSDSLEELLSRALAAGLDRSKIRSKFAEALDAASSATTVAFVECNTFDLGRMSQLVENATGVSMHQTLIDELPADWRDRYDAVAVPLFHLADVAAVSRTLDRVVELNFLPSPSALRRIAMLDPDRHVIVVLPTQRGVERVTSLVRQYFPGSVDSRVGDRRILAGLPPDAAVVTTNAIGDVSESDVTDRTVIVVDWELDQASATSFAARIDAVNGREGSVLSEE